jgi:pimeloyl-[acyl-carrier protein] methyl ester esterase
MPVDRILLLPGMDGTGKLLLEFSRALPKEIRTVIPVYLTDRFLSYENLTVLVRSFCADSEPFVLMAESFSTPLAIRIAAENPTNLKGLILCTGFAVSPVRGLARWLCWILAPVLMRPTLPDAAIQSWLTGANTPRPQLVTIRETIASVRPSVLAKRLRAILTCDARSDLRRVAVPVLYLQARHDRLVSSRCFDEIRRIQPGIRLAVIDGPHLLLQREPEETGKIVAEYVQSL